MRMAMNIYKHRQNMSHLSLSPPDSEALWMSFWKLGRDRREELLWRPVAEALGAKSYRIYDNGLKAEIPSCLMLYSYEIVARSLNYLQKYFKRGWFDQTTYGGNYTVVELTIIPPQTDGVAVYFSQPPAVVRSFDSCTTISTVASGYRIIQLRDACLIPFKIAPILTKIHNAHGLNSL